MVFKVLLSDKPVNFVVFEEDAVFEVPIGHLTIGPDGSISFTPESTQGTYREVIDEFSDRFKELIYNPLPH